MGNLCVNPVKWRRQSLRLVDDTDGEGDTAQSNVDDHVYGVTENKSEDSVISKCTRQQAGMKTGVVELILSGPKAGAFSYVNQNIEQTDAKFEGTISEFLEKVQGALPYQLHNKVKLCPNCDKVNAYTLLFCNSCCEDLSKVDIGWTDNVFTGFIFGISRTKFPLIISIRYQDERLLVFDDLLQLTPCHINCIYTAAYLPDMRCLFERPKEGLALLEEMFGVSWESLKKDFLGNEAFRRKVLPHTLNLSDKEIRQHVIAGLNFPPSQYQIHLQFMLPPMMPFHYHMYTNGRHFCRDRFFPYEYVTAALKALTEPLIGARDMDMNDIVKHVSSTTVVNYHQYFGDCYKRYGNSHRALAAWDPADFEKVIVNGVNICRASDMALCEKQDLSGTKKADTLALQNYGRPFVNNRPSGTFYKYAKNPPLSNWLN